jgi:hypothetical protein
VETLIERRILSMKNRYLLSTVIFVFSFSLRAQEDSTSSAFNWLLAHSQELISSIAHCDSAKMAQFGYNCHSFHFNKDTLVSLLKKSGPRSPIRDRNNLISLYLDRYRLISVLQSSSIIVCDSISINLFIKVLAMRKTDETANLISTAYRYISEYTNIDELRRYKKELIKNVEKFDLETYEKYYLLALVAESKNEKEALLKQYNFPLDYKALLGDTSALRTLIEEYKTIKEYLYKKNAAEKLIFTQQKPAIEEVIKSLKEPIFFLANSCTTHTLLSGIILPFMKYYPKEKVFSSFMLLDDNLYLDTVYTSSIIKDFAELIRKQYSITIPALPKTNYPFGLPCPGLN